MPCMYSGVPTACQRTHRNISGCGIRHGVCMCGRVGWGSNAEAFIGALHRPEFMQTRCDTALCPENVHGTAASNKNACTPGNNSAPNMEIKNVARFPGPWPRKRAMCPISASIWWPAFCRDSMTWSCEKWLSLGLSESPRHEAWHVHLTEPQSGPRWSMIV